MDDSQMCELLLKRFGLRVRPEMGQYILRRLQDSATGSADAIPIMGGDARTGIAVRQFVTIRKLQDAMKSIGEAT